MLIPSKIIRIVINKTEVSIYDFKRGKSGNDGKSCELGAF